MHKIYLIPILLALLASCNPPNPNLNELGVNELKSLEVNQVIDTGIMAYVDTIYVPIYSDIYVDELNQNNLLAATLSIRNSSTSQSLFITEVLYYNTHGDLVKKFIEKPIRLNALSTVNYVIEKEDDTGGNGANFIVITRAKNKNAKPIIQAIMIGEYDNKGFAFTTDGYSVSSK